MTVNCKFISGLRGSIIFVDRCFVYFISVGTDFDERFDAVPIGDYPMYRFI